MNIFPFSDLNKDNLTLGSYDFSGWIATHRQSKNISFIELTDGTAVKGLQLVVEPDLQSYVEVADQLLTGASVQVSGELVTSPANWR